MRPFLLNIVLAILWCATWGSLDFYTLLTGFLLGYLVIGVYSRVTAIEGYGRKAHDLLRFSLFFIRVLVVANLQIAWEILTPTHRVSPRIIRFDVPGLTSVQRTVLVNVINLTPGTLVVDQSKDRQSLYVHCMYAEDREKALRELAHLRDKLLSEVF